MTNTTRQLSDITKEEYGKVLRMLDDMGREYSEKVNSHLSFIMGVPYSYINIYFKLLEHLKDFKGKTIIDIGSGPAYFLNVLHQMGARAYAVDSMDYSTLAEPHGIRFHAGNILDLPDNPNPRDLFPEANFDEFDAIISRLFFEQHALRGEEKIPTILKKLRPLSRIQIHETTGTSLLSEMDLTSLGYKLISEEQSPFLIGNKVYVLGRTN